MLFDTTGSWTPVALSADLPAGTVMPARTPAGPIALWRSQSGRAAASADRCPHRGMRLSHGFVRGEALSCIYHGWSYARTGNCLRIPAHPGLTPPETIRVGTHEVEESDGVIWVADGEPAAEPPRLEGVAPLRSLTAHASVAVLEAAADAKAGPEGLVWQAQNSQTIRLLLVPQEDDQTLIHVLLDDKSSPSQRIAASRAVETLRRKAEDLHVKGIAP
ncbi:Rieske 2Fe-2S domain-containing protein [Sinorhizobium numidicum]|uniref:Rieske 2Fe-2S domain-containing protein n=1 Tax=Sinorhizobium numidicum TaxID=680248 RepID=A0ABY8CN68_9HYPH|nr:Rieske 2Fe-2S domain-containing protein [Sinorhizobium numidicum]WEX74118.1 Rieske 2Fe-2S domain-containing protein [Sinorhizobium numidicum]WEX80103.1 Rieske 2Fe-2S domain-containing protein [Sinorhizobium numidicum]